MDHLGRLCIRLYPGHAVRTAVAPRGRTGLAVDWMPYLHICTRDIEVRHRTMRTNDRKRRHVFLGDLSSLPEREYSAHRLSRIVPEYLYAVWLEFQVDLRDALPVGRERRG